MQNQTKILLITELDEEVDIQVAQQAIGILESYNFFQIYTETKKIFKSTTSFDDSISPDYIICIGENKTLAKCFRILSKTKQVPIISISNSNEHLLTSYAYCSMDTVLINFADNLKKDTIKTEKCVNFCISDEHTKKIKTTFASELQIFRGMEQSVVRLNIYMKTEGDNFIFLTQLWGDGLIIATPLGSLGRSMSLHGPIMHKQNQNFLIVPNCPLSLNFRPICLPKSAQILVEVEESSRSAAKLFVDGQEINELPRGKRLRIYKNSEDTQFVKDLLTRNSEQIWIINLRKVIGWGEQFSSNKTISAIMEEEQQNS